MKESIREQMNEVKDLRASAQINKPNNVDDDLEQRQRKQREQSENDRRMKESIREQMNTAKDLLLKTLISV